MLTHSQYIYCQVCFRDSHCFYSYAPLPPRRSVASRVVVFASYIIKSVQGGRTGRKDIVDVCHILQLQTQRDFPDIELKVNKTTMVGEEKKLFHPGSKKSIEGGNPAIPRHSLFFHGALIGPSDPQAQITGLYRAASNHRSPSFGSVSCERVLIPQVAGRSRVIGLRSGSGEMVVDREGGRGNATTRHQG